MPHKEDTVTQLRASLEDPPVAAEPGGGDAARPPPDLLPGEIFPGSPVLALGVCDRFCVYLDVLNQVQMVDNHTKDRMSALFGGRGDLLRRHFPSWSNPKNGPSTVTGWRQEEAREAMQRAATARGVWKSHERLRGLGAWPDADGGPLLHCGDRLLRKDADGRDEWLEPGELGEHVYSSDAPGPRPAACTSAEGRSAAEGLLETLCSWNWARGETDAYLLFGWIAAAMFGGALDWRPMVWLTGDAGTGKSTLQKLITQVLGGEQGIVAATDVTEAGVRSVIQRATVPISLDEAEAEADNRRMHGVIKLARQAASGGLVLRGSADHQGADFRVRSCFIFSSILIPPLLDQDISRIAALELMPLERGATPPRITDGQWRRTGRRIRRRIFEGWPQLHVTLESYRQALARAGHTPRGCDQFGALLTMADLALTGGEPTGEELEGWTRKLDADAFRAEMDEGQVWERMLAHLFSQSLDTYRSGVRHTVGEMICFAAAIGTSNPYDPREADRHLRRNGIAVDGRGRDARIVLANQHEGINAFFRETRWAAGVHRQAARRIPGAETPRSPRSLAKASTRVVVFPVRAVPWLLEEREDARPDTPEPADLQDPPR